MSDKSRNREDTKKIRENSANSLSDLPDEVFEDGLALPDCATIFFNYLKRIESDLKKLFEIQAESKDAQIKVTESLQNLSDKLDETEAENKKKDEKITQLEERVKELEKEKEDIYMTILMRWNNIPAETVCCCMESERIQTKIQMILSSRASLRI